MRFGLDSTPDSIDVRESNLILGALCSQRRYHLNLASRNRDPEAAGRNMVNALELKVLMDKISDHFDGTGAA